MAVFPEPAAAQVPGFLRISDRMTFQLEPAGEGEMRVLAPDVEGVIEVGRLKHDGRLLRLRFDVAKGPCHAGIHAFEAAALPAEQAPQLRDRLAILHAAERQVEMSWEALPRHFLLMPESLASIVRLLTELLGADHPQVWLARAYYAHSLLDANRAQESLAELESVRLALERLLDSSDHDLLRTRQFQLLALEHLGRRNEVMAFAEALLRDSAALETRHPLRWRIMASVGERHFERRNFALARELDERAQVELSALLGNEHVEALSMACNLAALHYAAARGKETIQILEPLVARIQARLGKEHRLALRAADLLARGYLLEGRWREGLPLAEQLYDTMAEEFPPDSPQRRYSIELLSWWYRVLGRYAEAETLLRRALSAGQATLGAQHPALADTRAQLAMLLLRRGRPEAALAQVEAAQEHIVSERGEENQRSLWLRRIRCEALSDLGRHQEALAEAQRIAAAAKSVLGSESPTMFTALRTAGRSARALGRHDLAMAMLEQLLALQTKGRPDTHPEVLESRGELGLAYAAAGLPVRAVEQWEALVAGAEALRQAVGPVEEYRQGLLQRWLPYYRELIATYFRMGRHHEAFSLSERIKGRGLLESLAAREADAAGFIATEDQAKLASLASELASRDQALGAADASGRADALHAKAEAARALGAFRLDLSERYPKFAALENIHLLDAHAAAQVVPADAAFVSYVTVPDGLMIFVYTHDRGLQVRRSNSKTALSELVRVYRSLVLPADSGELAWRLEDGSYRLSFLRPSAQAKRVRDSASIGKELARVLLEPIGRTLARQRRWIIAPEGALAYLPFETLPWAGGLVARHHDLSYIHSLSVLAMLRHRPPRAAAPGTLFAMGAPDFGTPAPISTPATALGRAVASHPLLVVEDEKLAQRKWQALPGSAQEVRQAAILLGREASLVLTGSEASEARLQELDQSGELSRYRYLLFATHAYLNTRAPQLSALVLAQDRLSQTADGYVTAAEWVRYNLASDLIVLSACDTALGPTVHGEGITGLPYAMLVAGNRNALLSLWKVDDGATTKFILDFFARLQSGQSQVQALADAKRAMLRSRKYPVAVWAAFVLYGA